MKHYQFFQNRSCEFFPCHPCVKMEDFNCLFCYCPLYALGNRCGGNFCYMENGIKDCSNCIRPHIRENYDEVLSRMGDILEIAKRDSDL